MESGRCISAKFIHFPLTSTTKAIEKQMHNFTFFFYAQYRVSILILEIFLPGCKQEPWKQHLALDQPTRL